MSYWMLGLQALQMVGGLQAEREQVKMRNKLNQAQNKVLMASAFDSVSAIIRNKTNAYKQSQEVAFALQREELATSGAHAAQAGAAGVTGQSVRLGASAIHAEALRKDTQRQQELQSVYASMNDSIDSTLKSAVSQTDTSKVTPNYMATIGQSLIGMGQTFFTSKKEGGIGGFDGLKFDTGSLFKS